MARKDYTIIEFEYLTSNDTVEEIAKRHGIKVSTLISHIRRKGLSE